MNRIKQYVVNGTHISASINQNNNQRYGLLHKKFKDLTYEAKSRLKKASEVCNDKKGKKF